MVSDNEKRRRKGGITYIDIVNDKLVPEGQLGGSSIIALVHGREPDFAGLTVTAGGEGETRGAMKMDVLAGLETGDDLAALSVKGFNGTEEETEVDGGIACKVVGESGGEGDEDADDGSGLVLERGGGRGRRLPGLCHRGGGKGLFGVCHTNDLFVMWRSVDGGKTKCSREREEETRCEEREKRG